MRTNRGILAWFAHNPVAANLLMIGLLVGGLLSLLTMPRQVFPDIKPKLIAISVAYPGASPAEVESGIITRIEEAIDQIQGLKQVSAKAQEGLAELTLEVTDDAELASVLDEVKLRVDAIVSFPENSEKPLIYEQKFQKDVIWVQLFGALDERALKQLAEQLRDELVALPEVSNAELFGARPDELVVAISEQQLRALGLSFDEVVTAISSASLDLPAGTLRGHNGEILLRASAQAYQAEEFRRIELRSGSDGRRLTLADVATVSDGFSEVAGYARFDGQPTIGIAVRAVGDEDAVRIGAAVNAYVASKQQRLPAGVTIASWADTTFYLKGRLELMTNNMLFGGLLVFVVLAAFLRLQLAFWVLLGLPVSFFGALLLLPQPPFDVSINMISLFGFILVLGILVDDAIVIGESAYSEVEARGYSLDNVIRGANRVAMPATFGVLTTVCAFIPMLLVGGPFGVIWNTIGWVVVLCLIFSLVESKLILPAHLARMKPLGDERNSRNPVTRMRLWCSGGLQRFIAQRYCPSLQACIRQPWATLICFVALIVLSVGLVAGGLVRSVAFPEIPSDFIRAELEMVEGTAPEATAQALDEVAAALVRMDEQLKAELGEGVVRHRLAYTTGNTSGMVMAELSKGETRTIDGTTLAKRWREQLAPIAGVRNLSIIGSTSPGPGADVAFVLKGKDLAALTAASELLKQRLRSYDGLYDIADDFALGKEELTIRLLPGAGQLGFTLGEVARQVRQAFYGAEAQRLQRGREEVKVMVRYPLAERRSVAAIENMRLRAADGRLVPFTAVAFLERGRGYASISRVDGERAITISAAADKSRVEPGRVAAAISAELPQLLAAYPQVSFGKEGAAKEEAAAYDELLVGGALALIGIYALMAIPLRSYSQPLVIMAVIPFGIIGAIFGHWLLGLPLSILSLCGIIALAGVVVNDSLILVEFINHARRQGMALADAVVEAGRQRFRAILLTSLTTFCGLVPIILEKSLQAQMVIPMAISLAFGILFSTVIILYLVPAIYMAMGQSRQRWRQRRG